MAVVEVTTSAAARSVDTGVTRCERRAGALYPPMVKPAAKMPGSFDFLRRVLKDPLLALPPEAYEQPVVFRRWPVPIAYACEPAVVRAVLVDKRHDFERKPSVQRYVLGPLLGNGILLAEGRDWRWQRQTTAPSFRHSAILSYVPTMWHAAENAVRKWRAQPGLVHNIAADMTRATYEVIARTILVGGSEEITEIIEKEKDRYNRAFPWSVTYGLLNLPDWLPRPGRSVMNRRDQALRATVADMIGAQTARGQSGDSLLARLVKSRHPDTDQAMSREQLIDNVLTFLLAGHHTTAMALTWTLYLVACAPEWEAQMLDEIQSVVPEGPVTAAHIEKLVIVQQVLKEAMRLFPPVPGLSRMATRDTELGNQRIAKGTVIDIPVYAIHRHRRVWSDPDRFDPSRFAPENEAEHASCQYLPFGAGPRICSGFAFALLEATVLLATFLRAVRFETVSSDYLPIPADRVVLVPKEGMSLRVTERAQSCAAI